MRLNVDDAMDGKLNFPSMDHPHGHIFLVHGPALHLTAPGCHEFEIGCVHPQYHLIKRPLCTGVQKRENSQYFAWYTLFVFYWIEVE